MMDVAVVDGGGRGEGSVHQDIYVEDMSIPFISFSYAYLSPWESSGVFEKSN